jgi:hypothetical protein
MKDGGCRHLIASGGIKSDHEVPANLGRAASRVVLPGLGAIFLGRRQQREDQVLPRNLAAGPQICGRSRGHHHLSAQMRPVNHAEDRALTAAAPLERESIRQLLTLEEIGDREWSQFLRRLRGLAPNVPQDFLYTIWSSRLPPKIHAILAGQQDCSLKATACCAHRISEVEPQTALTSVGQTPQKHRTSAEDREPHPPCSGTQLRAGPPPHQLQEPISSAPGVLVTAPEIPSPA